MVGYIYLITDTTNNMKYTGKHHYHIEGQLDPNYHGSGVIIKNIYKKRPETLKEEYIKTCYSEEEMCSDEQYYIEVFDTLWPNGYNLTEGGDGGIPCEETRKKMSESRSGEKNPMFGKKHSEETKQKIGKVHKEKHISEETKKKLSSALKGRIMSDEHKQKIREASKGRHHSEESKKKMSETKKGLQSGDKHPMFGKHHSEEAKKKMSLARKGKPAHNKGVPMSEEQKKKLKNGKTSKKVLQFTLNGEFIREWPSTAECERNGFDSSFVSSCCRGKYKSAYGYIWRYKEDYS